MLLFNVSRMTGRISGADPVFFIGGGGGDPNFGSERAVELWDLV